MRGGSSASVALQVQRDPAALYVRLRVGGVSIRALLDTGSSQTWLPASKLRLWGRGRGECRPVGTNFSHVYSDGSSASGVHCEAELQLGHYRFRHVIGAALHIDEASRGVVMPGVLALSPAEESSLRPLLRATAASANATLGVCARSARLIPGAGCAYLRHHAHSPHEDAPVPLRLPIGARHWKFNARAVMLALRAEPGVTSTSASARAGIGRAPRCTTVRWLHTAGERVQVHLDTGATHIFAPAALRAALREAVDAPASVAWRLDGGDAERRAARRSDDGPWRARAPSQPVLVPISEGPACAAAGRRACVRRTIVPALHDRPGAPRQWLAGVPFFERYDVDLRLDDLDQDEPQVQLRLQQAAGARRGQGPQRGASQRAGRGRTAKTLADEIVRNRM